MSWIVVPNCDEMYLVNEEGQVFSRHCGRILKPGIASNGYPTVVIVPIGTRTLHSLVAEAFLGPCPPGLEILHGDGVRTNPRLSNLRYGTRLENIEDSKAHGQWWSAGREANRLRMMKLSGEQAQLIRENPDGLSLRALGRQLGITHGTVRRYLAEKGGNGVLDRS